MTPYVAIAIHNTVKGVNKRVICLLKEENMPAATMIMLCEYVVVLAKVEEALLLYLNDTLLATQKNTKGLEEKIRKDVNFAAEIEAEIRQKTNLSFEVH